MTYLEISENYIMGMGVCDRRIQQKHLEFLLAEQSHDTFHVLVSFGLGPRDEDMDETHTMLEASEEAARAALGRAVIPTLS